MPVPPPQKSRFYPVCTPMRYKHEQQSKSLDMLQLLLLDYIGVDFVAQL